MLWLPLLLACGASKEAASPTCPNEGSIRDLGALSDGSLDETSGLTASTEHPGVLWAHNDQGDSPRLFALDETGEILGESVVLGPLAFDWEDIAAGLGPDGSPGLWIADTGDNDKNRSGVSVVFITEPEDPGVDGTLGGALSWELTWPDTPRDAEAMLIDPISEDRLLLERSENSPVFASVAEGGGELVELGTVELGARYGLEITGAAISPSGDRVILRLTSGLVAWQRAEGESLADLLSRTPDCTLRLDNEPDGEAIAMVDDGFFSVGEGESAMLHFTDWP